MTTMLRVGSLAHIILCLFFTLCLYYEAKQNIHTTQINLPILHLVFVMDLGFFLVIMKILCSQNCIIISGKK